MKIEWVDTFMSGVTYYSLMIGGSIKGEFWEEGGVYHIKNDPRKPTSRAEAKQIVVENFKKTLKDQLEALEKI